jgi:hypothetical protein
VLIYKIAAPSSARITRHKRQYRESGFVLVRNSVIEAGRGEWPERAQIEHVSALTRANAVMLLTGSKQIEVVQALIDPQVD